MREYSEDVLNPRRGRRPRGTPFSGSESSDDSGSSLEDDVASRGISAEGDVSLDDADVSSDVSSDWEATCRNGE